MEHRKFPTFPSIVFQSQWLIISVIVFSITAQAAPYHTYVIATYGGNALLPPIRQQLNASPDGGTVTTYQDKLVVNTTATNYRTIQQLIARIDGQPQALMVAVRVGNNDRNQANTRQGQVIIDNRGIQGNGIFSNHHNDQQRNSLYQVQTLSGSAANISTSILWSLTQSYAGTDYPSTNRPFAQIIIQQQALLSTTQGIAVTPRLLPNGQVEVKLSQFDDKLVPSNLLGYQKNGSNHAVQRQQLESTIIVPRGQWVTIGQIKQSLQSQSSANNRNSIESGSAGMGNRNNLIQLLVQ